MAVLVLKNALLILLMILIVHFMIRNKLVDDRNAFRRRLIYMDTVRANRLEFEDDGSPEAIGAKGAVLAGVADAGSGMVTTKIAQAPMLLVTGEGGDEGHTDDAAPLVAANDTEYIDALSADDSDVVQPAEGKKKTSLSESREAKCEDASSSRRNKEDRMRELYDFVYSEEDGKPRGSGGSDISKYFPEGVQDGATVDRTELVEHSRQISKKLKARDVDATCNFEVIGSLCGGGGAPPPDSIQGMEHSTASFYSVL